MIIIRTKYSLDIEHDSKLYAVKIYFYKDGNSESVRELTAEGNRKELKGELRNQILELSYKHIKQQKN